MQSPSDPDVHSHPHPDTHAHVHSPVDSHGHGQPPRPSIVSQPPATALAVPGTAPSPGPASLFLAGSRDRLVAASGVVAVLWLLVWWALD